MLFSLKTDGWTDARFHLIGRLLEPWVFLFTEEGATFLPFISLSFLPLSTLPSFLPSASRFLSLLLLSSLSPSPALLSPSQRFSPLRWFTWCRLFLLLCWCRCIMGSVVLTYRKSLDQKSRLCLNIHWRLKTFNMRARAHTHTPHTDRQSFLPDDGCARHSPLLVTTVTHRPLLSLSSENMRYWVWVRSQYSRLVHSTCPTIHNWPKRVTIPKVCVCVSKLRH